MLPCFTLFSFHLCMFHLARVSSLPLPSSPSVLYLCPVMQLTANLSSSLILSSSPTFTLSLYFTFHQPLSIIFTLYLLFPRLSLLSSFPFLCLCVTGHAVNNKAKQVVAALQVDSHGTLSLGLDPALHRYTQTRPTLTGFHLPSMDCIYTS